MARGKRYDNNSKLNIKKVIAVIVFILVVIMFISGLNILLSSGSKSNSGKIEAVTYYTVYENKKWGVINSLGEKVVKPMYNEMIIIPDNTKPVFIYTYDVNYEDRTYKSKAINEEEKEIAKGYDIIEAITRFDNNQEFCYVKNILKVQKNNKYGLIDFSGKKVLACEYDNIEAINGVENSLLLLKDEKYGVCDYQGKVIINPEYKNIKKIEDNYKNGYIVANLEDKYGIIGFDKTTILECKYDDIKDIYVGTNQFVVKEDDVFKLINKEGETIWQGEYEDVEAINGSYIVVKKNGKYGVINSDGETKIKFNYSKIESAGNNYIVKNGSKYSVLDIEGNEKISPEYVNIQYIARGDFYICDYIEDGNLVSKFYNQKFEEKLVARVINIDVAKGYVRVYKDNEYKYYNFKFEEKTSNTILTTSDLFLSKKNGKYGFVDKEGKVVVDYLYDDATEQNSSGFAAIKSNGLWGAVDSKGNVVVKPKYNLDKNDKIDFIGEWHLCEDSNANYYINT